MSIDPTLAALAAASPDGAPHRVDEPYRRALIGIYARLAATARALGHPVARPATTTDAASYPDAAAYAADLATLDASLRRGGSSCTGTAAATRARSSRAPST